MGVARADFTSHVRITANSVTKGTSQANSYLHCLPGGGDYQTKESGLTNVQFLAITDLDWDVEQTISLDLKVVESSECNDGRGYNDSWLLLAF